MEKRGLLQFEVRETARGLPYTYVGYPELEKPVIAYPDHTRMSVEAYLQLDHESMGERYEYIDGYAYMLAGGTTDHGKISANIIYEVRVRLPESRCSVYTSDVKVRLAERRYLYPDISISCDERDDGTRNFLQFPRLIVEVLSPSTVAYDRIQKFDYYRTCPTLEEYVLVDTQRRAVDIYRRAKQDLWTLHFFREGDNIELTSLSLTIPLAVLYRQVVLASDEERSKE